MCVSRNALPVDSGRPAIAEGWPPSAVRPGRPKKMGRFTEGLASLEELMEPCVVAVLLRTSRRFGTTYGMAKSKRHVKAVKARWAGTTAEERSAAASHAARSISPEAASKRARDSAAKRVATRRKNHPRLNCRICGRPARSNVTQLCHAHTKAWERAGKPATWPPTEKE